MLVFLRDGSSQTILRAATLREKLQIQLSTSPSHSILTLGQPVPALTLLSQVHGSIAIASISVTVVSKNILGWLDCQVYKNLTNRKTPRVLAGERKGEEEDGCKRNSCTFCHLCFALTEPDPPVASPCGVFICSSWGFRQLRQGQLFQRVRTRRG